MGSGWQGDRGREAEHATQRAQQAVGLWGGGQEVLKFGGIGEEMLELRGAGVDVVVLEAADEPGLALGQTAGRWS